MEKSELAEIIKRAIGEAKRAELGGYEIAPGTNAPPMPDIAMQISHIAMLGEIAYQLAVMNERNVLEDERLGDRVEGISISVTALEGRLDRLTEKREVDAAPIVPVSTNVLCLRHDPEDERVLCGKLYNHTGNCGWGYWQPEPGSVVIGQPPAYVEYNPARETPEEALKRADKLKPPRTICGAGRIGPFRQELCGLEKGHSGLHGWNRFRTPDGICPAVSNGHEGPLGCCLADGHDGSHRWGR